MTKRPFSTRPSYVQSVRGLQRLHTLALSNQDETPEADAVRDSLEQPWYDLSEVEKKRISGLSGDLYSISEPSEPSLPMNPQAQRKLVEAMEAREAGEWDKALDLLRRWGRYLEPTMLSYLRGSVWKDAGDYATATLFFEHASRLDPSNWAYKRMFLDSLKHSDPSNALALAREILAADEGDSPVVVVSAAQILFESTENIAIPEALPVYHQLTFILERTLARFENNDIETLSIFQSKYVAITGILGLCYARLGESQSALRYYNLALAANPNNDALLVARGILRYGVEPGAVDDFEQAIRHGSPYVWPFYYLAHHYFIGGRYEDCRRTCERALDFPANHEIKGDLYEWLAISQSESGFPPERVRSAFEAAVRLVPDNERVRHNFAVFQETATLHTWEMPRESRVKALGQAEYLPTVA
jgi:tetratricopeptide (TPR) repeat protein